MSAASVPAPQVLGAKIAARMYANSTARDAAPVSVASVHVKKASSESGANWMHVRWSSAQRIASARRARATVLLVGPGLNAMSVHAPTAALWME